MKTITAIEARKTRDEIIKYNKMLDRKIFINKWLKGECRHFCGECPYILECEYGSPQYKEFPVIE